MPETKTAPNEATPPEATEPSKQPKSRIATADDAITVILSEKKYLDERVRRYRDVALTYDREPPDDEEDLKSEGLSWASNVDWGGMETGINEAVEKLFNLATQPQTYCQFSTENEERGAAKSMQILAEEDSRLLNEWTEWLYELEQMLHNRVAYGLGIFYWDNPHGWHFRSLHPGNLILPRSSKVNPDSWSWCALRSEFDIVELLKKLSDTEVSKSQGWNVGNIRKAIQCLKHGGETWAGKFNDSVEKKVYDLENDLSFSSANKNTIPGYILYVREWTGKISYRIVLENGKDGEFGFLYENYEYADKMSDLLAVFPHQLSQGIIDRIKGYGIKMLPYHDAENRTMNHALDTTWISSNFMLKGPEDDMNRMQDEMVIGPFTHVPDTLDIQQQSFSNPSQGLINIRNAILAQGADRNRAFGGKIDVNRDVEKTASEARMRYQENKALENIDIARFYKQLSMFHHTRWQKIIDPKANKTDPGHKEAKEMLKRASERGCPKEFYEKVYKVEARSIFGNGDPVNQYLALMDLAPFFQKYSAEGKKNFLTEVHAARLGSRSMAKHFIGEMGMDDFDRHQIYQAQMENAIFEVSDYPIQVPGEGVDDTIHTAEHLKFAEQTIAMVDRQQIPEEIAFARLSRVKPHLDVHISELAGDELVVEVFNDARQRSANIENRMRQMQQHLEAEAQKKHQQALEELRNPKPSHSEQVKAETEILKQRLFNEKHALEMQILEREAESRDYIKQKEIQTKEDERIANLRQTYGIEN